MPIVRHGDENGQECRYSLLTILKNAQSAIYAVSNMLILFFDDQRYFMLEWLLWRSGSISSLCSFWTIKRNFPREKVPSVLKKVEISFLHPENVTWTLVVLICRSMDVSLQYFNLAIVLQIPYISNVSMHLKLYFI